MMALLISTIAFVSLPPVTLETLVFWAGKVVGTVASVEMLSKWMIINSRHSDTDNEINLFDHLVEPRNHLSFGLHES